MSMVVKSSAISLFSAVVSIFAILISLGIFRKVYEENYKKPWLYIGISSLILAFSQLFRFLNGFFMIQVLNQDVTEFLFYVLDFISIMVLTYGIFLESLILRYYKGKFVKFKFIPVQEGSMDGDLDINVANGFAYLALKKDRDFLLKQFSEATKKGFEGFLIGETPPLDIRKKYNIEKTPIAWINQSDSSKSSYVKEYLDDFSDIVEPININDIISFIDNFLEQSQNPFIMIDLNLILKINNFTIVSEFLKYIANRIIKYDGVLICLINNHELEKSNLAELNTFLKQLE